MPEIKTRSVSPPSEFGGLALIGGHSALNFLNTIKYRGQTNNGDRLLVFSDIAKWAHIAEILDDREYRLLLSVDDQKPGIKRLHRQICNFREQVRMVVEPQEDAGEQFEIAAQRVEHMISLLRPTVIINRDTRILEKSIPVKKPQDLKFRIIACIADFLEERPHLTIKSCSGHDCDWLFIDRTKAKRRQWCDTRTCGNNARVRRHRTGQ